MQRSECQNNSAPDCGGVREKARPVRSFASLGCAEKESRLRSMWQEFHVRQGFRVSVFDALLPEPFSFRYDKENRFIDFGFCLEGEFVNEVKETPARCRKYENRAGMGGMGFSRHTVGEVGLPGGKKVRMVHMHVLPDVLASLVGEDLAVMPPCLRRVVEQGNDAHFSSQRRLSPRVQAVANELFFGIRNNFDIRLYMEGKALELLGLSLAQRDCPRGHDEHALCPRERDVIQAIRLELEEKYADPPSLPELSQTYNLGTHKIQAGFRVLFGMSVFAFIKEFKLQKAKLLFDEGNMNVSEVAWAIGYINLGHFSAAYKKRFGILPKAYLLSIQAKAYSSSPVIS